MSQTPRTVCLHFHIFKNAGTTIDSILEKNFSTNAIRVDAEKPNEIIALGVVIDFLNKNPEVKSFSCHQMRFPIPNITGFNFIPMLFIRQPLDRIFSIYSFNKRRSDQRTYAIKKAQITTLGDYIKLSLEGKQNMTMKNFQVLFLSRTDTRSQVGRDDLDLAIKHIKNCAVLGVVDRLDQSFVVAEEFLKTYFPNIDLSYTPKNVSEDRIGSLEQKLKDGRSKIGETLWKELVAKNELDIELYEIANEELNHRIKKIDNFDEKIKNFKNRCAKKKLNSITKHPDKIKSFFKTKSMLSNRRIWFSPENKSFYYKNMKTGTKKIICYLDNKNN